MLERLPYRKELRQLHELLPRALHWQFLLLVGLAIVLGAAEMLGVGAIFGFVRLASGETAIQDVAALQWLYGTLGLSSKEDFLVLIGLAVIGVYALKTGLSIVVSIGQIAYANRVRHHLSRTLLQSYFQRPYIDILGESTQRLRQLVIMETQRISSGLVTPLLGMIAEVVVFLFILGLLLAINPSATLGIALAFSLIYLFLHRLIRPRAVRAGAMLTQANAGRFKTIAHLLDGLKEVSLRGVQDAFIAQCDAPSLLLSKVQTRLTLLQTLPRSLLELLVFAGLVAYAVVELRRGAIANAVGMIALFGVAAARLMPSLNRMLAYATSLKAQEAVMDDVYRRIRSSSPGQQVQPPPSRQPLTFERELVLENLSFRYPGAAGPAIKDFSLRIPRNACVGILGQSGSGKSTLIDLIAGLLRPQEGQIRVDDTPLGEHNTRQWQDLIGYVPQQIFLTDDSLEQNILFGDPRRPQSEARIRAAIREAALGEVLDSAAVPGSLQRGVGERGSRLSGGQRQRVALARALYRNPPILILDEATSALDAATERAIIEELRNLKGTRTILMITHKPALVCDCDFVVRLDAGGIDRIEPSAASPRGGPDSAPSASWLDPSASAIRATSTIFS